MQAELNRESAALNSSLEDIGGYFKSRGVLEVETAKQYKTARKSVTKILMQTEGCRKSELADKPAFEMVRDAVTEQTHVLSNWTLLRNSFGMIAKIHDDFGQFVTKVASHDIFRE